VGGGALFSICIPTCDRVASLKECLGSLLPQAEPYRIPVCVSDNASTDDTMDVLDSLKKSYPLLYFRSNDENLGFDRNLINAIEMASSKYVWSMADRFKLMPSSIAKIYRTLSQDDLDLLVLRVRRESHAFSKEETNNVTRYDSAREVFVNDGPNLTLLGSHILPTKAWKGRVKREYVGPGFAHFNVLFDYLADLNSVKAMRTEWPAIYGIESVKSRWRDNANSVFQTWLVKWVRAVSVLPNAFSDCDKQLVIKSANHYVFSTAQLFDLRSERLYSLKIFNEHREALLKYTNTSLINARLVSVLPVSVVKILKKMRAHLGISSSLNPLRLMHLMRMGQNW
jgi:glycosyltransferase involved in cell wall biosynthesis